SKKHPLGEKRNHPGSKLRQGFWMVFRFGVNNWGEKLVNTLQLHYSNAKLEATNNLIKLIKRNAFGFRNFENFKKRIFIALNIKKERTKFVLSQA
ncbi:transposase, partial [Streptococcus pneumoniae]